VVLYINLQPAFVRPSAELTPLFTITLASHFITLSHPRSTISKNVLQTRSRYRSRFRSLCSRHSCPRWYIQSVSNNRCHTTPRLRLFLIRFNFILEESSARPRNSLCAANRSNTLMNPRPKTSWACLASSSNPSFPLVSAARPSPLDLEPNG
jgi:hypothetical protein